MLQINGCLGQAEVEVCPMLLHCIQSV